MTTTVAETEGIQVVSTTTAAMASVSTTTIGAGNIMSTAAGGMAGSSSSTYSDGNATSAGSSLSAVEEMNFYLRRLTLGGTSDVAQIDSFGGGPDYEMFLNAVQSVGTHHGWTEAQIMRTVEMKLKDKAREYYGALLPIERPSTMDQMKNWFRSVFGRRLTMSAGKRELERCIRNPDETLGEFAQRLKVIANKMFPPSSVNTPAQTYHRDILLVNQFMDGIEARLANEVSRSGEFYSLDECLQEAEQCEEVVSRMVHETRYDARISAIRRVETREEVPYRREGRDGAMENRSETRNYQRNERRGGRNPQGGPRDNGANRFPYMRTRCLRCGEEGHRAIGCRRPRKMFCYHCGKEGAPCSLNSQRPSDQPNS
ncbi:hypothetical protein JTB14_002620 [Gonioctena quinquepunctata]|nr:hypothetical protein JTB14_002620 [Gonioctena quinquepunctata]